MDAEQTGGEISVVDYLFLTHPHLFANMGENPYWRAEKAKKIVDRMLSGRIIYCSEVLTTDARTQQNIDHAVREWYPPEKVQKKPKSARVSLHSIFTEVVKELLGYEGKTLFNKSNEWRKRFVDDGVVKECCVVTGSGKSRRYKVDDSERLEARVMQLLKMDKRLKPHIQEVKVQKLVEAQQKAAETREASRVTYALGGKKIEIYSAHSYSRENVLQILKLVHEGIFSEPRIDKILDKLGKSGKLRGADLVEIINKTNGIMNLSSRSVQVQLESRLGLPVVELSKYFSRVGCAKYVHILPGIIDEPYILRQELDGLVKTIEALSATTHIYRRVVIPVETPARPSIDAQPKPVGEVTDERTAVLNEVRDGLRRVGKCPYGNVQLKLLKAGVLDESSEESIRRTYDAFAKEVEDYSFFDFNLPRLEMGLGWEEFRGGPMKLLIEAGIAKDIVASLGYAKTGVNLYVLKKRSGREEMCKALNLDRAFLRR